MDSNQSMYTPSLALTVISSVFIGIAAVVAVWIMLDIIYRRGWKTMMAVMIPVYVVNALYLWPITLWTYLKYGRPPKAKRGESMSHCAYADEERSFIGGGDDERGSQQPIEWHRHDSSASLHAPVSDRGYRTSDPLPQHDFQNTNNEHRHKRHHKYGERPMFVTVTAAVCHCGVGCVIGDVIGEWIVYGQNITIQGRTLWPGMLIDFVWAIALGVLFQYFSIAPMAGDYGPKSLYRALKADFLSLLFFEIGLCGWMAVFQIVIFQWRLKTNTVTYWWMMQVGMFFGHWTAVPINWWLIKAKVKEPCI